ncbi:MAG: S41 family peptidase [Spirochaeta sp.]|jgi:carboxyl-terminal processing protease|nr:S41 family peptidase [Spirochaeta sp.]
MDQDVQKRRPVVWIGVSAALFAVLIAVAAVPGALAQGSQGGSEQALGLFEQVYRFIERNYVDEVDPDVLIEGALEGMFEALDDPHSAYLDTEEMRGLTDTTSGEFGGVGMFISKPIEGSVDQRYIEVVSPIEDTPAYRAGLRAGDRIKAVEGQSTADLSVDGVVDLLRGEPGSEVKITILRGADMEFPVSLERAIIEVPTVKWDMIDDDIGFLRVIQFTPYTDDRVKEAIEDFKANNYRAMIIDLRSNPGGLLDGVVDVADLFFDGGLIVETRGRVAGENQRFTARRGQIVDDRKEIVVLIDGGSASAAEILAAAIKDRDRGTLIGSTTYGKGSVQQVRSVGAGGFRLTMSRYYTPSGTNIDEIGVEPDIVVEEPELSEEQEDSYARLREEQQIATFVEEQDGEPTDSEIDAFISELRTEGISLSDRWLRRLIRIEANRVMNRTEVYDLEYDLVLQRAVEYLEE